MKVVIASLCLVPLFAAVSTNRIVITGSGKTVAITDAALLDAFRFGPGPGNTMCAGAGNCVPVIRDWIVRWTPVAAPDPSLPRYEITFQMSMVANGSDNRAPRRYDVMYVYSPVEDRGYVYLPGPGDAHYENNISMIDRGAEWDGHWFPATEAWTAAVQSSLAQ